MATQAASDSLKEQQKSRRIAGVVIGGHGFQHMYADGFLVLQDSIMAAFGLTAGSLGILHTVRQMASGLLSMGGGFVIDMFSGKRGILLAGSLFTMGLGYLLIAAAPNFGLVLVALALGAGAASFWHPLGLGILSYTFPHNRAFAVSMHRSAGNVGELITPLLVGLALAAITWRQVLLAGFFLITAVSLVLLISLSRIGLRERVSEKRSAGAQFKSLGELFKTRTLPVLLLVSGFRGMADRAFVPFLPVYIAAGVRATDPSATLADVGFITGVYLAALSAGGIVISPLIGALSDRIGRRSVIIVVLMVTTVVLALMWWVDSLGALFGVLVFAYGTVRFAINNLTQAASLDVAEGKRLEGSMIGMLWGNNALFGAFSPALLGLLIITVGGDDVGLLFPYAIALHALTLAVALFLPRLDTRARAR